MQEDLNFKTTNLKQPTKTSNFDSKHGSIH
jgi:hypothetical protein